MSDLDDAIERLNPDASPQYLYRGPSDTADVEDDLRLVIEAARERDALAAVIEEALHYNWRGDNWDERDVRIILSRTPSDALVERDARIRAEVIDWFQNFDRWLAAHDREVRAEVIDWIAVTFNDYDVAYGVIDSAREHFGLTKGADRG